MAYLINVTDCGNAATETETALPSSPSVNVLTRIVVAAIYITLTFGGLSGYALVILGFRRDRKTVYSKQPFYTLVYHLAAGDVGMLIAQIIMLPIVFTGEALYGMGLFHNGLGVVDSLCFFVVFFTSFLIAINRFCVFMLKPSHWMMHTVFDRHIHILAVLPWVLAVLGYTGTSTSECLKLFTNTGLHYMYACPQKMSWFGIQFMTYLFYLEVVVPVSMFCMYIIIFVVMKTSRGSAMVGNDHAARRRTKMERSLLIQSVIICTVLEIEVLMFFTVPGMGLGFWSGVFVNCFTILNSTITPYIFLFFNAAVLDSVKKVLGIYHGGGRVSVTGVRVSTVTAMPNSQKAQQQHHLRSPSQMSHEPQHLRPPSQMK